MRPDIQARSRLRKTSRVLFLKHKTKVAALGVIAIVLLIFTLIFDILKALFTTLGAILIFALSIFLIVRFISVVSAFPGSFWFWRRHIELDFNRDYCDRLNQCCDKLCKFLSIDFEQSRVGSGKYKISYAQMTSFIENVYLFKHVSNQHLQVYQRMAECNTLTAAQSRMQRVLDEARRISKYKLKLEIAEITKY